MSVQLRQNLVNHSINLPLFEHTHSLTNMYSWNVFTVLYGILWMGNSDNHHDRYSYRIHIILNKIGVPIIGACSP